MRVIYIALCIFFVGCNTIPGEQDVTNNIKTTLEYFEHVNDHEWDKVAEMYASKVDIKKSTLGIDIIKMSRNEIKGQYEALEAIYPDYSCEVLHLYPSGDTNVIVEYISRGTHKDGKNIEMLICSILTFEKGLISQHFRYHDRIEK